MNLVICEDTEEHSENLMNLLLLWSKSKKMNVNCKIFESPQQLIDYIIINKNIDVLFLDVYFENSKIDGITLAKNLRKKGIITQIILTTMDRLQAVNGFFIDAIGFLAKPVQEDELSLFMDKVLKRLADNKYIDLKFRGHMIKIYQKDIIYFEKVGRELIFHTLKGDICSDMSLKQAISLLDKDKFTKIYKSIVIAFNKIKDIKITRPPAVVMINTNNNQEISLELSRYIMKDFMEAYSEYMRSGLL